MKTIPNPGPANPEHPLHRASYALEDIKWPNEDWRNDLLMPTAENAVAMTGRVLAATGHSDLDALAMTEAVDHYALSLHNQIGVPLLLARSIFTDGLYHGLALAAGLTGEAPDHYREP